MTTIAYKGGKVAYESRVTVGDVILTDNDEKSMEKDGVLFFCSGTESDFAALIDCYFGKASERKLEAQAIVFDPHKKQLLTSGYCKHDGYWDIALNPQVPFAIGTGSPYAYAAMDMGASAKKAVKVALLRDIYSGGKVRQIKLKGLL